MAYATWDDVWTDIGLVVALFDGLRLEYTNDYLAREQALIDALNLDAGNAGAAGMAIAGVRSSLASNLAACRSLLDPFVLELGRIIKAAERDPLTVLGRVSSYMLENPDALPGPPRIASRGFTRGGWTPSAGNRGNGTVERLTVDAQGQPIEATFADVISLRVIADRQTGADVGREQFEVRGQPRPDNLTFYQPGFGSGQAASITAASADDSQGLLLNPSFSDAFGSGATLTISNWTQTLGAPGDLSLDTTDLYRAALLEVTPASLRIGATAALQQKLSMRRTFISFAVPYYAQIAWNRSIGGGTGTLRLTIGAKSVEVNVDTQVGWQILAFPVDESCFVRNYDVDDLGVTIAWTQTSGPGSFINVDDLVWAPFRPFDNHWLLPVSGDVPWLLGDAGSFSDQEAGAKIQRWLHRSYGTYLPSAPAPPAAGCVATSGPAGNVEAGTHAYVVTFVAHTSESGAGPATSIALTAAAQVQLSGVPPGPQGVTARRIYRTAAGANDYRLAGAIPDNTSTIFSDDLTDAALGGPPPAGVTIADPV